MRLSKRLLLSGQHIEHTLSAALRQLGSSNLRTHFTTSIKSVSWGVFTCTYTLPPAFNQSVGEFLPVHTLYQHYYISPLGSFYLNIHFTITIISVRWGVSTCTHFISTITSASWGVVTCTHTLPAALHQPFEAFLPVHTNAFILSAALALLGTGISLSVLPPPPPHPIHPLSVCPPFPPPLSLYTTRLVLKVLTT